MDQIRVSTRSMAILIDPEKMDIAAMASFTETLVQTIVQLREKLKINQFYFFIGGSTMENVDLDCWIDTLKENTKIPIVIFPGSHNQISKNADGLLFLNLISGRNPEYLIGQQVKAAARLYSIPLEVIPTAYLLIDGGKETAVQRVSQTVPLSQDDMENIVNHAYTGKLMGNHLVYLEAGSGALQPVATKIVREVSAQIDIPLIVGGGLRSLHQIEEVFNAGAKMVVVGTAIEENVNWNG